MLFLNSYILQFVKLYLDLNHRAENPQTQFHSFFVVKLFAENLTLKACDEYVQLLAAQSLLKEEKSCNTLKRRPII
jgi:hypothetical protein